MLFNSLKKFVGGSDYSQAEDYVEIDLSHEEKKSKVNVYKNTSGNF